MMFQIVVHVPTDALEAVKQALFDNGAGSIGEYEHCCWQTLGSGQFRPLQGADPHIGDIGTLCEVEEYRIELICEEPYIHHALSAMIEVHPYEQPSYYVKPVFDLKGISHLIKNQ